MSVSKYSAPSEKNAFHEAAAFSAAVYEDDIETEEAVWHWHEELEIGYITAGEILLETGNGKFSLREGDGFFINSGILHGIKNKFSKKPSRVRSMVFDGSVVGGSEGSVYDRSLIAPLTRNRGMAEYLLWRENREDEEPLSHIRNAWETAYQRKEGYVLPLRSELSLLCLAMIRLAEGRPALGWSDPIRERRVRTILEFIYENYDKKITAADICRETSISSGEAFRCFKKIIGITPVQYLRNYRSVRAAQSAKEQGATHIRQCHK